MEKRQSRLAPMPGNKKKADTESPEVQAFIAGGVVPAETPATAQEPKKETAATEDQDAGEGAESSKGQYPWDEAGLNEKMQLIARIPAQLFLVTKYLGETTYGESITRITMDALEKEVRKRCKERGIPLPKGFGKWK